MLISKEVFKNIRRIQIKTGRYVQDMLAGAYHSAFKGRGMEFEDVRAYQPGDEVRSIDWNVTARMNFPYIKNFREERELTVMLLVDVSSSSDFGTTGRQKKELIAEIGAVLAYSAINNNDKVGLILFTDTIEKYLPPQKGVKHVLRVIRELLIFKPKNQKTDIAQALNFLGKIQKRRGVAFIISDFISPNFKNKLCITSKRHDVIAISVIDPHEMILPKMGLVHLRDLENDQILTLDTSLSEVRETLARLSRTRLENCKNTIEQIGAGFIDIRSGKPYATAIREFFQLREKRR